MGKVNSATCPFCNNTDQTILHLFVNYPVAISFWAKFVSSYYDLYKKKPALMKHEIVYGVVHDLASCLTLNHLIVIDKINTFCTTAH